MSSMTKDTQASAASPAPEKCGRGKTRAQEDGGGKPLNAKNAGYTKPGPRTKDLISLLDWQFGVSG